MAARPFSLPGRIDRKQTRIVSVRYVWQRIMPVASCVRVTALPLPSLVDEIGFLFEGAAGNTMWIRETDREFRWLAAHINADALFGENWYMRAESGECIPAELAR